MDTSYNYQIYLDIILIFLGVTDIFSMTVSMNQNQVGNLGSDADIMCSYIQQPGDIVLTITLQKHESGNFVQIATYFAPNLNTNATFSGTTAGTELSSRAELTNPTTNNNLAASMKIKVIQCGDEAIYKCIVSYVTGSQTLTAEATTNLTVKARAKSPDTVPMMNPSENIVENMDVYFTCTGDVGRPAGTFIWQKYKNNVAVGSQMSGDATTQHIDGTCTVNKTSTIKLRLTKEDDMVVIRCNVEQELVGNAFFKQTVHIRIYYKVDKPYIQRDPPDFEILAGRNVTFTCSANGNPLPTYAWYDVNNNKLKDGPTYKILNAQVSDSGTYKCTASNTYPFNGLTFNQTSSTLVKLAQTTQARGTGFTGGEAQTTQARETGFTGGGAQATQACGTGITRGGGTDNTNVGLLIGTIIGVVTSITLAVILVIVVIYRRKNQSTEKAVSNQYRQENMAYETLDSRAAISEVSVYNSLSNTDNAIGQHLQIPSTYDRLDGTQADGERNIYQILTDSRSNAQEMNTEYEIPNSN